MKIPTMLVVGLALAGGSTLVSAPKSLVVPLKWMLSVKGEHPASLPSVETTGGMRTLKVERLIDRRDEKRQIGENAEKKIPGTFGVSRQGRGDGSVPIYTDSDVADFVQTNVCALLRTAGLELAGNDAEATLQMELIQFWALETSGYRAEVRVRCRLSDSAGNELWSAIVGGVGENAGRSLKPANYCETFSSAIFELAVKLLEQEGFKRGLRKG